MRPDSQPSRAPRRSAALAVGVLLLVIASGVWAARVGTTGAATAAAGVTIAGIMGIASLLARSRRMPVWAWWGMATAMSGVLVVGMAIASPASWADLLGITWVLPWCLFFMGTTGDRRRSRETRTAS